MPLPERVIQPVNVSRGTLSYAVPDELEGVTNGTLANIIRQLSSLSRHAEEMFGNLFVEAEVVAARSSSLQAKIDKLAIRVTQLDSTVEEGMLGHIALLIFINKMVSDFPTVFSNPSVNMMTLL